MPPVKRRPWAVCLVSLVLFACGGSSSTYRVDAPPVSYGAGGGESGVATTAVEARRSASFEIFSSDAEESDGDSDESEARGVPAEPADAAPPPAPPSAPGGSFVPTPEQFAQAEPRRREQQTPQAQPRQAPDDHTATDATSGPLLIYQAILHLAVYQVQDNQRSVVAIARELDGYLAQQSDTIIVIRVPARRFQEALGRIEALGDVLHRNIQATDVSEEFRDTQIRLRNLEQVRDRLAALLAQARTVEESLQIERELERLTTEIESMKGRLRFLEDRIAFSTITVNFSPREQETLQGELFNLPFDFLYNLGLRTLLNLR